MDTRSGELGKTTLRGEDVTLMNMIDETFHNVRALESMCANTETPMSAVEIRQRLDALVEQRFVVHDEGYFLSIVLPIVGA